MNNHTLITKKNKSFCFFLLKNVDRGETYKYALNLTIFLYIDLKVLKYNNLSFSVQKFISSLVIKYKQHIMW